MDLAADFFASSLADVVGRDFVRESNEADAVDGILPRSVIEPGKPTEVARVLATATESGLKVMPRGGGTKLGWGGRPERADVLLSLRRLDQVLEHAAGDMTVTVEAGCTIEKLQRTVAERGQRLALDPLWPERATVGGVLASADGGPLRWAFGPPRDLLLGVTVALADGTLARSGGKVVKNVAGYDLPKLFTGSFGTLGVITQATFRLHPLPGAVRDLGFEMPVSAIGAFTTALAECSLLVAAAQVVAADNGTVTACVRIESSMEAIAAKADRVTAAAVKVGAVRRDGAADVWGARESLFEDLGGPSLVAKVAFLPARLADVIEAVADTALKGWSFVAQAYGVGLLRIETDDVNGLVAAAARLRSEVVRLGGSLVVLACPTELKARVGVWGDGGDAVPLMRRVKEQLDPKRTLNPGRFVGGI